MRPHLPSGTLTFLFTDLENSTRLWEQHPDAMQSALARHDALLRQAVEAHHGIIIKTTGDGLHAVFESASDALAAACAGQHALIKEAWPESTGLLKARMGLHTGESQQREGDYYGSALNRAARIMSIGHGGQILLSGATSELVQDRLPADGSLLNLGEHGLRDLARAEHIFQLAHPDLPSEFPPLKSLSTYNHNLPLQLTSFIGRERELAEVKRLLDQTRLLTLLGPGGTGKTRLMLQAAADAIDSFRDGVWLVELAPLTDAALLPQRLAATLNVQERRGRTPLDTLVDYLRLKHLLLLLDNVEHLVADSAQLVEHLLLHCPNIKIMVTGREGLFIGGETTLQLSSLSLPGSNEKVTLEMARASEAVLLFLERAQATRPDFQLSADNAAAIVEICRRLDGIPLAIELAAARLNMLSVEQIAARLNDRFRLLTGGRRTALPRQQTLQALIDWSWNLLDEDERKLLRRLSVFSGGWTLEAAEVIAGSAALDVFERLSQLVNKSLVIVDQLPQSEVRYRMLESIRQYAQDKLVESGESVQMRDAHAAYFAALTQNTDTRFLGQALVPLLLRRVIQEMDNFRSALEWTLERDALLALQMAGQFFLPRGYWYSPSEGRRWLEQAIANSKSLKPSAEKMREYQIALGVALTALGGIHFGQGRNEEGAAMAQEAVAILRQTNDTGRFAFSLAMESFALGFSGQWEASRVAAEEAREIAQKHQHNLPRVMALAMLTQEAALSGDFAKAQRYLEEARTLSKELGNPWIQAQLLQLEGRFLQFQGNLKAALVGFEQSAKIFEDLRDRVFAMITKSEVSHIMRQQGDFEAALPIYRETILYFQEVGNAAAVAHQLECFAYIAIGLEEPERAAKLFGAARTLRERSHNESVLPWEKADFAQAMTQLTAMLGESARDAVMAEGRSMSMDEAVVFALRELS